MAGIYFHIPFCKQACTYCNFHFSTNLQSVGKITDALCKELEIRKRYIENENIGTIYFGGGTPSLLSKRQLSILIDTIYSNFTVLEKPEITIEVNPDDLSPEYLKQLQSISINRLSIGIQSFFEDDLKYMHRAHTSIQALECVERSQESGFDNISIDLIYGVPNSTLDKWKRNLDTLSSFDIQHLSCYALTVEPKTILAHQISKKISPAPDDENTIQQFSYLMDHCNDLGFRQYEISNYSKPGFESKHNSNYWNGIPYLGIGPSAHSYNGISRQWNVSNNVKYVNAIEQGLAYFEIEELSSDMKYNELIMTKLRTVKGVSIQEIPVGYLNHFNSQVDTLLHSNHVKYSGGFFSLTQEGMFIADSVLVSLFV